MRPQIVLFGDSITQQSFQLGGWGAALANNFSRKADVFNRGYGGYNTRWALFLLHQIFPLHGLMKPPVAATIFFGANDAALFGRSSERQHVPVEEYKENLRKIVHHLKDCSSSMLVVLITPPPIDEDGRMEYARVLVVSWDSGRRMGEDPDEFVDLSGVLGQNPCNTRSVYGERAMKEPERTNEVAQIYAKHCVELAEELSLPSINLWAKMQETDGWQKKYLRDGLHLTAEGNEVVYNEVVGVFEKAGVSAAEMAYDFPHHSEIDAKSPQNSFQIQCT